ncbi:MAG: hypothetical protein ACRD2T_09525 [Thermoanaerobaculia bacterium]
MTPRSRTTFLASLGLALAACRLGATGHGPVYGLATPTLGQGVWSLDVAGMARAGGSGEMAMARPMLAYGITEDLQISFSLPVPLYRDLSVAPARTMAMMPGTPDAEFLLGWRFHRRALDVGARFESTAYLGLEYPTDPLRGGVRTSPGILGGLVTGYASRSVYAWAGALYQRSMSPRGGDHTGDTAIYSLVYGYRPPHFRAELPHPDWRVFVELVGEVQEPDEIAGRELPNTGGHELFAGPTVLGLYGPWGISGGPLFPIYSDLNGAQREEDYRFVVNFTYWF